MKSYLEITLMMSSVVLCVVWSLTFVMNHRKAKRKTMMICSIGASILLWIVHDIKWSMIILLVYGLFLYRTCLFAVVQSVLLYHLILNGLDHLHDVVVKNGLVYVNAESKVWIAVLILGVVMSELLVCFELRRLKNAELMVPVHLETAFDSLDCIGFIDTGNQVMADALPVVFVRQHLKCDRWVDVDSLSGSRLYPSVQGTVHLHHQCYEVMLVHAPFLQVECLLHADMR